MKKSKIINLTISERFFIKIEIEQGKSTFKGYLKGYNVGDYVELFCASNSLIVKGAYNGKINYNDYRSFALIDNVYVVKTNDQEEDYFYYEKEDEEGVKYYKSRQSKLELRKDVDNNFFIIDEKNNIYSYLKGGYVKKITTFDNNEYTFSYSSGHTKSLQDKNGRKLINNTTQYYKILESYVKRNDVLIETITYTYISKGIEIKFTPEKGIEEIYQIISNEDNWSFLDKKTGFGYKINFTNNQITSIEEYQNSLLVKDKTNKKNLIYQDNEVIIEDEKNHYEVYHFNDGLEYEFNNYGYLNTYKYFNYKKDYFLSEVCKINGNYKIILEDNLIKEGSFNSFSNWEKIGTINILSIKEDDKYKAFFDKYCSLQENAVIYQQVKLRKNVEYNLMFFAKCNNSASLIITSTSTILNEEITKLDKWTLKKYKFKSNSEDIIIKISSQIDVSGFILIESNETNYSYTDGYLTKIKTKDQETNISLTNTSIGSIEDKLIGNTIITYDNKLPKLVNLGNGIIREYEYNNNNLLTKIKDSSLDEYLEENYQYNNLNQIIKYTSQDNIITKFNYDNDFIYRIIYPTYQVDIDLIKSLQKTTLMSSTKSTTFEENVNENNNLSYIKNAYNHFQFTYNQNQDLINIKLDNEIINEFKYQFIDKSLQTLLSEKTYLDVTYLYSYNAENLITKISKKTNQAQEEIYSLEYDEINRLTKINDKLLNESNTYSYDSNNNIKQINYPSLKEENLYENNQLVFNKITYNTNKKKISLNNQQVNQIINILEEEKEVFDEEYLGLFNSYNKNVISSERITIFDVIKQDIYIAGNLINSSSAGENYYIDVKNKNNLPYLDFFPFDGASTEVKYNFSNSQISRNGTIAFLFNPVISTSQRMFLFQLNLGKRGRVLCEIEYVSTSKANLYINIIGGTRIVTAITILEERIENIINYNKWNYLSFTYSFSSKASKISLIINDKKITKSINHSQVAYAGDDSFELGKYYYNVNGNSRSYFGKISNLLLNPYSRIKEEKINKHYYYSVLLTNLADNENRNINQYIYDYQEQENETWIPLKSSLLTNKNNLPIKQVNPKFIYDQEIKQNVLAEFDNEIIYQTNCKNKGYFFLRVKPIISNTNQVIFALQDNTNEIIIKKDSANNLKLKISTNEILIGKLLNNKFQYLGFTYEITNTSLHYYFYINNSRKEGTVTLPFTITNEFKIILGNSLIKETKENIFLEKYNESISFKGYITDVIFSNEYKTNFESLTLDNNIVYIDKFDRLNKEITLLNDKTILTKTYTYKTISGKRTSLILSKETINNQTFQYTFSSSNLLQKYVEGNTTYNYEYDNFNQLIKANNEEFTYDNNGNLINIKQNNQISKTFTYNSLNQLIKYNNLTFEYKGLYLNKIKNGEEVNKEFVYEGNNLIQVNDFVNNTLVEYTYDIYGIRKQKKINNSQIIKYTYQGSLLLKQEHFDETNHLAYYFIFAYDNFGRPLKIEKYSSTNTLLNKYYYVINAFNDVVGLIDEGGVIRVKYSYSPYGEITITQGNDISIARENHFRFKCYYYDDETNLYYLESRYYNPEIGRFISPDSVDYLSNEVVSGINLYSYCGNDPVNKYDPTGHFGIGLTLLIATGVGLAFGFGIEVVKQASDGGKFWDLSTWNWNLSTWNWWEIGKASLIGAATGFAYGLGGVAGGIVKGSLKVLTIAGKALTVSQSVGLLLGTAAVTNFAAGVAGYAMHTAGSETESFNILKGISEGIGQTGKGVLSFFTAGMYVCSGVWKVGVGAKNTFSSILGRAAGRFIANYVPNYMFENLF